jgi:hypothetical protein
MYILAVNGISEGDPGRIITLSERPALEQHQ